jgi:hypothetical protein
MPTRSSRPVKDERVSASDVEKVQDAGVHKSDAAESDANPSLGCHYLWGTVRFLALLTEVGVLLYIYISNFMIHAAHPYTDKEYWCNPNTNLSLPDFGRAYFIVRGFIVLCEVYEYVYYIYILMFVPADDREKSLAFSLILICWAW